MGKDFLKLKHEPKKLRIVIFSLGMGISFVLGVQEMREGRFQEAYTFERPKPGEDVKEQELLVQVADGKSFPIKVSVEEKRLSQSEAEEQLLKAESLLDEQILGENENPQQILQDLCFPDIVEGTFVEVTWVNQPLAYVNSDGTLREDVEISESVVGELSGILSCQEYVKDYHLELTFLPQKRSVEKEITSLIRQAESASRDSDTFRLPTNFEGKNLQWKEPADDTFLYFFFFTLAAVVFLKIGEKRDEKLEKQIRRECLERDYPQVVSKFAMLLSAGLSLRNAWIRIVRMNQGKSAEQNPIYEEMHWAVRQMEKGVPELEIYESFGTRVGLVHYKKLMALFVSDKRRGSRNLLEVMNEEMLQAWEEKKRTVRQQGEQIGTKLLLPMMGMLSVVFVMILVPAFLSFGL